MADRVLHCRQCGERVWIPSGAYPGSTILCRTCRTRPTDVSRERGTDAPDRGDNVIDFPGSRRFTSG